MKKVVLEDLAPLRAQTEAQQAKFLERMHVQGRSVDFGPVKTDGTFRLKVKGSELQLWPVTREKECTVCLDAARVLPGVQVTRATTVALDADGKAIGLVPVEVRGGRMTLADPQRRRSAVPGEVRIGGWNTCTQSGHSCLTPPGPLPTVPSAPVARRAGLWTHPPIITWVVCNEGWGVHVTHNHPGPGPPKPEENSAAVPGEFGVLAGKSWRLRL